MASSSTLFYLSSCFTVILLLMTKCWLNFCFSLYLVAIWLPASVSQNLVVRKKYTALPLPILCFRCSILTFQVCFIIFCWHLLPFSATVSLVPVCQYNQDCPTNLACDRLSRTCMDPCSIEECAPTAICRAINHKPTCECPAGYSGNPNIECIIRKWPYSYLFK